MYNHQQLCREFPFQYLDRNTKEMKLLKCYDYCPPSKPLTIFCSTNCQTYMDLCQTDTTTYVPLWLVILLGVVLFLVSAVAIVLLYCCLSWKFKAQKPSKEQSSLMTPVNPLPVSPSTTGNIEANYQYCNICKNLLTSCSMCQEKPGVVDLRPNTPLC